MPDFDFEAKCDATLMAMKRLMAANGKIVGGYSLWATADVKTGAFVVSHKGVVKAKTAAKTVKKELKGSKQIAAGQILVKKKKVYFLNTEGSSTKVDRFITKVLVKEYKKLGFLKKFKWATQEEVEELLSAQEEEDTGGTPDEDAISLDELGMTEQELAGFKAELEADEELKGFFSDGGAAKAIENQNQEMQDSFRAAAAEDDLWRREMTEQRDRIAEMEAAIDRGEGGVKERIALNEAREEYALNQAHGIDPFPVKVGGQVDESTQALLNGNNALQLHNMYDQYQKLFSQQERIHMELEKLPEDGKVEFIRENLDEMNALLQSMSSVYDTASQF